MYFERELKSFRERKKGETREQNKM